MQKTILKISIFLVILARFKSETIGNIFNLFFGMFTAFLFIKV